MRIEQSGNYPFEDTVLLRVQLKQTGTQMLRLRIPAWSIGYELVLNGKKIDGEVINGYASCPIDESGEIRLTFEKGFMAHNSSDGGVYYTYGPFLMTLKIQENRVIDREEKRQTEEFPAYEIYPESEWRYAVNGWEVPQIIEHDIPENPFWDGIPFEIQIPARRLKVWELAREIQTGESGFDERQKEFGLSDVLEEHVFTPRITSADVSLSNLGEVEIITLIPYGCSQLRLTVFPKYDREEVVKQEQKKIQDGT